MGRFTGFLIGAGFGLAFVLANAGPPVPPPVGVVLRVLAVAALVGIVVVFGMLSRRPAPAAEAAGTGPAPLFRFGPFYGIVVLIEVALIFGGIQVLRLLEAPWQVNVAWIALVVGLHFLPLAWYWRMREILGAALYISALGAAGLVMAGLGAVEWIPFVSGTVTGLGMLAGILAGLVGMLRASRADEPPVAGTAPAP